MFCVEMNFPAGRFHATPWDRQVNEGSVEWPPSPWRFLRTLLSTWLIKAKEIDENTMKSLIEKLAPPPVFLLPRVSQGHTRHYMPDGEAFHKVKKIEVFGPGRARVFDTFIAIQKNETVMMGWLGLVLSDNEKNAIKILLERTGFFGRAESWVEFKASETEFTPNCQPLASDSCREQDEITRVMVCQSPDQYRAWKEGFQSATGESKNSGRGRKSENQLPDGIFEALHVDTNDLKSGGWSQAPGSRWLVYSRPRDIFDVIPEMKQTIAESLPTVARFIVASAVPPRLTEAIWLADKIHDTLVKWSDGSQVFTGCDEEGDPLEGNRHAFIFCESNIANGKGNRGEVTHVTVFSPDGFGGRERKALDNLVKVWGSKGHDIQLVLLAVGEPGDFSGLDATKGECNLLAESRVWESRTPFVPTRYPKVTRAGAMKKDENGLQIGSPEHDVRRLLSENGFPKVRSVEFTKSTMLGGRPVTWLDFKTDRKGGHGSRSSSTGFGFKITFDEPVKGPIAVGFGAHFGLGIFVPVPEKLQLPS